MTPLPAQPAPKTNDQHVPLLMKNILSFFHLIDEVPGIAGALIGQSKQSGASSIKK